MKKIQSWKEDEWTREIYDDIYNLEVREDELDNDMISDWEQAFMEGWDDAA